MLANRLLHPCRGNETPIVDLFPEKYEAIPDRLLASVCAYVAVCTNHYVEVLTFCHVLACVCLARIIPQNDPFYHVRSADRCC